jgi:hypothetical protein
MATLKYLVKFYINSRYLGLEVYADSESQSKNMVLTRYPNAYCSEVRNLPFLEKK